MTRRRVPARIVDPVIDPTDDNDDLRQAVDALVAPDRPLIVTLSGPSGAGTTTLARVWAQHTRPRFPGGVLHIDAAIYTTHSGMALSAAVREALLDLDVPDHTIPIGFGDRVQLYRATLATRPPTLVLLDAATEPAQARVFAPLGGPSKLLVTSRHGMRELRLDGAHLVTLPPLPLTVAAALLRRWVGSQRVDEDLEAAHRLVELCGGLLADLRMAASHLAVRPGLAISSYVDELSRHERHAVMECAYRHLPPKAALLYRRLGAVQDLVTVTVTTAAVVARMRPRRARRSLTALANARLLTPGRAAEHWTVPVRAAEHAATKARSLPDAGVRDVAVGLAGHYLTVVNRVRHIAMISTPAQIGQALPATECTNVLAVLRLASYGGGSTVWQLCEAFVEVLERRHNPGSALDAIDHGVLVAGTTEGTDAATAYLRLLLAKARLTMDLGCGAYSNAAARVLTAAATAARTVSDPRLSAQLDELRRRLAELASEPGL